MRLIVIIMGLSACTPINTVVGGSVDTGDTGNNGGGGNASLNEIGTAACAYSAGDCLIVPGRVIDASEDDAMAIAGVRMGSDADHLSNSLSTVEEAAIGWCVEDSVYDICHATSARVEGDVVAFEFPLQSVQIECDPDLDCGATTIPDGIYRLSARRVSDPSDFDFGDGLQVAYYDQVTGWGNTDGDVDSDWVWKGIDPEGNTVTDIVIELAGGRYAPAASDLPDNLGDL